MEQWDDFAYGPLQIKETEERRIRCGSNVFTLGKSKFIVLLRLMSCQGGMVSNGFLSRGLAKDYTLRFTIYHLRKFLKKHFEDAVTIETCGRLGYKLSLSGEFLSLAIGLFHMEALAECLDARGYLRVLIELGIFGY